LVAVIAVAVGVALPSRAGDNWRPFAPHGWWAVGSAANILMWLFIGWEAMAQLAGEFRNPANDLPRAMALAFGVIATLYVGLAVATITVNGDRGLEGPARRPDRRRLRPRRPRRDRRARGRVDDGDDERLHGRRR